MIYQTKKGDTLEKLSNRFRVSISSIVICNPNLIKNKRISTGQYLEIPQAVSGIIYPMEYTYEKLLKDILTFKRYYKFMEVSSIGKSILDKIIPAIRLGIGSNKILCNASHHAKEWITTPLLMKFIELYYLSLITGRNLYNYNLSNVYSKCTIWIVPMVNPDGVNIAIKGVPEDDPLYSELLKANNNSNDFSQWKANIRGIDLNRNYDAGWSEYKSLEPSLGITGPSRAGYSGTSPESESETKAMVNFTRLISPQIVLAYHAQGEEIYWDYNQTAPQNSYAIAESLCKISGYKLLNPPEPSESYAGYKDWFIKEFNRPGFTIEVGKDTTPVPLDQFSKIVEDNIKIILHAALLSSKL